MSQTSSERKKMSKCLTEEAMSYFDECVSISTFDSSDFSAAEDQPSNSTGATMPMNFSSCLPQVKDPSNNDNYRKVHPLRLSLQFFLWTF